MNFDNKNIRLNKLQYFYSQKFTVTDGKHERLAI